MKKSVSTLTCSVSVTSLRSQRLRVAPANGATSADPGNRLMKSGTTRAAPAHGQICDWVFCASLPPFGFTPRFVVWFCGLFGL